MQIQINDDVFLATQEEWEFLVEQMLDGVPWIAMITPKRSGFYPASAIKRIYAHDETGGLRDSWDKFTGGRKIGDEKARTDPPS